MDGIMAAIGSHTRRAIVIGGGYIGVEVAENLIHRGLEVHLVEMMPQIMATLDHEMAQDLEYHMEDHGVKLHLGTAATSFEEADGGIQAALSNGESLTADLVVMAVGVRPNTELAKVAGLPVGPRGGLLTDKHMRTVDPDIYAVGDMVETERHRNGKEPMCWRLWLDRANRQGRIAADNIFCGKGSTYRGDPGHGHCQNI